MVLTRTLRVSVKLSFTVKSPAFRGNKFEHHIRSRHFSSAITSKMAQPKYLTGDKAGIDAFVDQFDVSSEDLIWSCLMTESLTCLRYSSSTAMVRMPRPFTLLSDYTN